MFLPPMWLSTIADGLETVASLALPIFAISGVLEAYRGLRAKRRATELLQKNKIVQKLLENMEHPRRQADFEVLKRRIIDQLEDLNRQDKKEIDIGLHQSNAYAEQRYIDDLTKNISPESKFNAA